MGMQGSESPREDGESEAGCTPRQAGAVSCIRVMASREELQAGLNSLYLHFSLQMLPLPFPWTAGLYLHSWHCPASRIPSLLRAGCAPVASFDGSSSPAGPTGQTKSFCNKGKVGINPFLNCTPRKFVT